MLATPKSAIELVLTRKTQDASLKLYENSLQRSLFWIAAIALALGAGAATLNYALKFEWITWLAIIFIMVSTASAAAYQIASALPDIKKLKNVERDLSSPLLNAFNDDMDLIQELAGTCERQHLSFARARFLGMAKHLRERIALLVGAIDKVGLVPIGITGYLSYAKAKQDGLLLFGGIEWAAVAFVMLYIFALRMTSAAQWMEEAAELYAHALEARK